MADKYEKYKHNIVLCFDLAATQFTEELQEDINDCCDEILKCIDNLKEYEKIGTIEEFKAFRSGDFTEDLLNMGYTKGYNKAIDEFAEKIKFHLSGIRLNYVDAFGSTVAYMVIEESEKMIDVIAEELKAMRGSE